MVTVPTTEQLMAAGAHFGHQASKWHPKMEPFIFGVKNGVHVINLEKTRAQLEKAQQFINQIMAKNGTIVFLGTKQQVKDVMKAEAKRCGMPYMVEGWVGGFLTNFGVVSKQMKKYRDLVAKRDSGELNKYTKKEQAEFEKEIQRLEASIGGVKDLDRLPDAIFVWDAKKERTVQNEARLRHVPLIAICDTNVDPTGIEYVIPLNDDGTKTIALITKYIADCIIDAKAHATKAAQAKASAPAKVVA